MEEHCINGYGAADHNQGWQWWLPLALYVWEHRENGPAVGLHIRHGSKGLVIYYKNEWSQEYWKQEIGVVRGCVFTFMSLIKNSIEVTWISKIWKCHRSGRSLSLLFNPYIKHKWRLHVERNKWIHAQCTASWFLTKSCLDCDAAINITFTEGREEGNFLSRFLELACGLAKQRAK